MEVEYGTGGTHPNCQCESGYKYNQGTNTCDIDTGGGGEGSGGEGSGGEGSGTGGEGGQGRGGDSSGGQSAD